MKKNNLRHLITLLFAVILFCFSQHADTSGLWPSLPTAGAKKEHYNLSQSKLFPRTLLYIEKNYVEPDRINPKEMFKGSLDEIQRNVPEILVNFNSPTSFTIIIDKAQKKFSSSLSSLSDFWKLMKEVFVYIELNYKGDVDLDDIESLAIDGALKMLDPHSALFTPEFYKEFKIDTGGEFGGLGIVITSKDGQLTVIAPIEGTPAWKAGIKSGDVITQIDDESTINMSLMKAVEKLRGKVGTSVSITVERKGKPAPFDVALTRAKIQIDSVKGTLIKDTTGNVGYIRVKRFQKGTAKDFYKELKQLQTEAGGKYKGLIIDLRNNPGGLLNEAVEIADMFIEEGVIVSTVGAHKKFIDEDVAHLRGTEPNTYPIAVLVNEGSASASEIVAGALRANERAIIIGRNTFGKGSVQSIYELGDDYALKLTIAQYLTAGKNSIQTVGVSPDVTVSAATIDTKYLDIIPNKPSSEKDLKKHLEQLKPTAKKEKSVISFFKPYIDEEDIEELRKQEYSSELDFKDDFEVKLATKMILASQKTEPEDFIKEASPVVANLEKQEEEIISSKMQEMGITWNSENENEDLKIDVISKIKEGEQFVERGAAGKEIKLVLTVTNNGEKTINKLIGILSSDNPLLDEREFAFGKIAPKQSVSRESTIEIPNSIVDSNIPYEVHFKLGKTLKEYKYKSALKVSEVKKPRFAFRFDLEKPKTVGAQHPVPRNKSVPLTVKIKNVGAGSTKELTAFISNKKNVTGLFIENGRAKLGIIKPGETKVANFSFKVLPTMTSSTFILEFLISDRDLLEFLASDLNITVESGAIEPQSGIWYEGPNIALNETNFPIVSNSDKYTVKGKITDDVAIKDYYIFVGDEKVVYESNPDESNSLNINQNIKIKDGNNTISIIARDNNNLLSRKSFVIQKGQF